MALLQLRTIVPEAFVDFGDVGVPVVIVHRGKEGAGPLMPSHLL